MPLNGYVFSVLQALLRLINFAGICIVYKFDSSNRTLLSINGERTRTGIISRYAECSYIISTNSCHFETSTIIRSERVNHLTMLYAQCCSLCRRQMKLSSPHAVFCAHTARSRKWYIGFPVAVWCLSGVYNLPTINRRDRAVKSAEQIWFSSPSGHLPMTHDLQVHTNHLMATATEYQSIPKPLVELDGVYVLTLLRFHVFNTTGNYRGPRDVTSRHTYSIDKVLVAVVRSWPPRGRESAFPTCGPVVREPAAASPTAITPMTDDEPAAEEADIRSPVSP